MFNIDFEEWSNLYKTDPEAFEKKRLETLKAFIDDNATDKASRIRLEQTLFRIEMTRKTSKNPLQSAIQASKLMWESVDKLQTNVKVLNEELEDCFNQPGNQLRLISTEPTRPNTVTQANKSEKPTKNMSQESAQVFKFEQQSNRSHH